MVHLVVYIFNHNIKITIDIKKLAMTSRSVFKVFLLQIQPIARNIPLVRVPNIENNDLIERSFTTLLLPNSAPKDEYIYQKRARKLCRSPVLS